MVWKLDLQACKISQSWSTQIISKCCLFPPYSTTIAVPFTIYARSQIELKLNCNFALKVQIYYRSPHTCSVYRQSGIMRLAPGVANATKVHFPKNKADFWEYSTPPPKDQENVPENWGNFLVILKPRQNLLALLGNFPSNDFFPITLGNLSCVWGILTRRKSPGGKISQQSPGNDA